MPQGKLVSSPSSNIPIGFLLFLGFLWDSYRKRGGECKDLNEDDGCFSYPGFYNNMVNFFEHAPGPMAEVEVWALLSWWTLYMRTDADLTPTEILDSKIFGSH